MQGLTDLYTSLSVAEAGNYTTGVEVANAMNESVWSNVFDFVPKGVDASKQIKAVEISLGQMSEAYDFLIIDVNNTTAQIEYTDSVNDLLSATTKTLFDSLSVSIPKKEEKKNDTSKKIDFEAVFDQYVKVIGLVFTYVFVSGGLSLVLIAILGYLALPSSQRHASGHLRLGFKLICGIGLALIAALKYNWNLKANYLSSAWMIPTIVLVYLVCVVANHLSWPRAIGRWKGRKTHGLE